MTFIKEKRYSALSTTRGKSCTTTYRKFLVKIASYFSVQIFLFYKFNECYRKKKRTAVALQGLTEKKLSNRIYETSCLQIEKGRVHENAA
jgi:hypothetical protein